MKYLDLITDAYRLRNVIDETQPPSPEQGATALRTLNQMLATWKVRGIDLNYFASNALTDTLTIPDWAEQGVLAHLAIRLPAASGITPELDTMAREGYETISAKFLNDNLPRADMSDMPSGTGQRTNGTFFNA